MSGLVNFQGVNAAALAVGLSVVVGLLPDGRLEGSEWAARNPRRPDRRPGSFKINIITGKWGDFATGERGSDLVSLAAYVTGLSQRDAAIQLAESLGADPYEGAR